MTLEYYRAYDEKRNRTSFILAHSLEEAKQSYKRNHGIDPEEVEWSDVDSGIVGKQGSVILED